MSLADQRVPVVNMGHALRLVCLVALALFGAGRLAPALSQTAVEANREHTADPSTAYVRSAATLYRVCDAEADKDLNWCEGYLLGVADVLLAMGNSKLEGGICATDYDPPTLGRVFRLWVERHPDKGHVDMTVAAQAAFREVWPCTDGPP